MRIAAPLVVLFLTGISHAAPPELTTEAERSGFTKTGRYEEVARLCGAYALAYAGRVRCQDFGETPEGRTMFALVASQDGVLDPDAARAQRRPVILIQGGIHAGEIEGKDAIFLILRELLDGQKAPGSLGRVTAVFVPVFNVDGHERFRPNNRPNQRGPEEKGARATGQNLNLNRDYVKAESAEMRAMLRLINEWDPVVLVDLHTTDGAKFEQDISVMVTPDVPREDELERPARALSDAIQEQLAAGGHLPVNFYPAFRVDNDPSSGFVHDFFPPRFSQAYAAARNRIGVLVETHSWRRYPERVKATRDTLAIIFERAISSAAVWRTAADVADDRATRLLGRDVTLTYTPVGPPRTIDFRGYAYTIRPSKISGTKAIYYDEAKPQVWRVPLLENLKPTLTVRTPGAGYLIPPAYASWIAPLLAVHGIRYDIMTRATSMTASEFEAADVKYERPTEGRLPITVTGRWRPAESRTVGTGALYVPLAQPRARLILHLFEPQGPDSLASWGAFNASIERTEYIDDYVLEEEAPKMLEASPELRAEFEKRLTDKKFAKDPRARLRFFAERHPSWDGSRRFLPILRVDQVTAAAVGAQ